MSTRIAPVIAGLIAVTGLIAACDRPSTLTPSPSSPPTLPVVGTPGLSITSATPPAGLPGATVRILGTGLSAGVTILLDGIQVRGFPGSTGLLVVAPPHSPGAVDISVTDETGQRATLPRGFTYQSMTLQAGASVVSPGGMLTVSWEAPAGRDPSDWVGLFRVGAANETYEQFWWAYTNGSPTGSKTLAAPMSPGQYEFRYFVEDGLNAAAHSDGVVVTGSGG